MSLVNCGDLPSMHVTRAGSLTELTETHAQRMPEMSVRKASFDCCFLNAELVHNKKPTLFWIEPDSEHDMWILKCFACNWDTFSAGNFEW